MLPQYCSHNMPIYCITKANCHINTIQKQRQQPNSDQGEKNYSLTAAQLEKASVRIERRRKIKSENEKEMIW